MRPLVAIRSATPYDARFLARSPHLWPLTRAARFLSEHDDFPPPEALARVFDGEPPMRFVPASPRGRRRRRGPLDLDATYDGRITRAAVVPTRPRSWHDLLNALVWGTFPRAKRALHARQHRAMIARVAPGAWSLPPARSPEEDALALVDEGGVVISAEDPRAVSSALRVDPGSFGALTAAGALDALIFGHAVYESLVFGVAPAAVAAVVVTRGPDEATPLQRVDAALARALDDPSRFLAPRELCRVDVSRLRAPRGEGLARAVAT
jgi:hypothetical protein